MKKELAEVVKEAKGNELKGKWESHLVGSPYMVFLAIKGALLSCACSGERGTREVLSNFLQFSVVFFPFK